MFHFFLMRIVNVPYQVFQKINLKHLKFENFCGRFQKHVYLEGFQTKQR